jgi:predicted DNA-binding transcriptional regulator AlpA
MDTNAGLNTHLSAAQLADRWGCSEGTLANWRCSGDEKGPRFIKMGRQVRYPLAEVERVERERLQRATHVRDAD